MLKDLVDRGYVKEFSSRTAAKKCLNGCDPILSKLALISVLKDGNWKHRLVLDCRVSGANSATSKYERIILPRIWDVIRDTLNLKAAKKDTENIYYFVCDFQDAFYKIPLLPDERRYFAVLYKGKIYIWLRVGQGSLNGPTLFGRLSALAGQFSQSLFSPMYSRARYRLLTPYQL